ncbi:MAG: MFS transporter [Steroidobacteraceae bacterium]
MSETSVLREHPDARLAAMSMLAVGVLATLVLMILPILVAGMIGQFDWDDTRAGWLASVDMVGSAIASLCVMTRIARIGWRATARAAIVVVVAGNLASIWAQGLVSLLAARLVTGFGNGLILSIAFVGLCHSKSPERLFGAYTFAQLGLQTLALTVAPRVIEAHGMAALYLALAATSAISALLVPFFPANLRLCKECAERAPGDGGTRSELINQTRSSPPPARVAVTLAAQAVYFLAPAAAWGYLERIGQNFSLTIGQVGTALGLASIAGIAGALSVIVVGARFGKLVPMGLGTVVSVMAMLLFMDGPGFALYLIAACLFNFAWNFTFPYQMGFISRLDRSGSVATLSLVAQLCAFGIGPLLASVVLSAASYDAVLWSCVAAYAVSLLMFTFSGTRRARGELLTFRHG